MADAPVRVTARGPLEIVQVATFGDAPDTAQRLSKHFGIGITPAPNRAITSGDLTVLWHGPDQWLIVRAPGSPWARASACPRPILPPAPARSRRSARSARCSTPSPPRQSTFTSRAPIPRLSSNGSSTFAVEFFQFVLHFHNPTAINSPTLHPCVAAAARGCAAPSLAAHTGGPGPNPAAPARWLPLRDRRRREDLPWHG